MDAVRALKQVLIFRDVPDSVLELVGQAAEEITVGPGEDLISPGNSPEALFVIHSGTVRAVAAHGNAPPVLFGTGETIGEVTFIDGRPVDGTATAAERAEIIVLRRGKVDEILRGHPEAGYELYRAIARSMAGRLRRAVGMIAFSKSRDG